MRARIYNKAENAYYLSEVYAVINRAGDWYVVDDPHDKSRVILVAYIDLTVASYPVNVEVIDDNHIGEDVIYRDTPETEAISACLTKSQKLHDFRGSSTIWNHPQALVDLLETNSVEKSRLGIDTAYSTKLTGWHYIETQDDIDRLMEDFAGFVDSVIAEINYLPGDHVSADDIMHFDRHNKTVRVIFHSQQTNGKGLEVILLSPRMVQIVPPAENEIPGISDEASLFLQNHMVFFYDTYQDTIPESYDGTYFIAMGLRWRWIEQGNTAIP